MSGIQLTGLYSGMDWSTVISEIIQADSAPMTELQATVTENEAQKTTLGNLSTDMTSLQTAVQGLQDFGSNVFDAKTATVADSSSSWSASADATTPNGSYAIDVTKLASESQLSGATGISAPLSTSSDVDGVTLATMDTATAVTAGAFTVNGQQVTVSLSDSLQDVFNAISTATDGTVTAAYDPSTDEVSLSSTGGPIVLGAANDTSNFLQAMGLSSNGTDSVTSASALGSVSTTSPLASAGLSSAITGLDSSGNGSFSVNGVAISYNVNTDSLEDIIGLINNSNAGVTASFDAQEDQMVLTNNVTGDIGIAASDTSGTLLASLGLTSAATLQSGNNAEFTVNGGPQRTSTSNNLTPSALGVSGLTVAANSVSAETINVAADTSSMQTALQGFITAYNQLQTDITTDTQISSSNGTVTTSILSGNYEVTDWAQNLRSIAFASISGLSGGVASLDDIGIGFSGTANQLSITDSAQLQSALANNPQGVASFFQSGTTGFANAINSYLNDALSQDTSSQNDLDNTNAQLNNQITVMQNQLNAEQAALTAEFTAMESAIEQSQSEESELAAIGSTSSSSSSGSSGSTISSSAYSTPSSGSTSSTDSTSSSDGSSATS